MRASILHVVGKSKYGGGVQVILPIAVAALRRGWRVDILATDERFKREIREVGVGVVDLDIIQRAINPWRDVHDTWRLYDYLKSQHYAIVQTHTSKGGVIGRLAARMAGVPAIIHTVHGFAFNESSRWMAKAVYVATERAAARWCDNMVTVSRYLRQYAIESRIGSPSQIVAVPNGLDRERVRPGRRPEDVRRELGIEPETAMILAAGRLAVQKGFSHLIESLRDLEMRANRPFVAAIAGDGELRDELPALARRWGVAGRVKFLGFRHDLGDLLAAADIVALPSIHEGLSISLLEAMAAGKPIVTTSIPSGVEVAGNPPAALLVEPGNASQLSFALARLLRDRDLGERLGRRAAEAFESHYTQERMVEGYLDLYESVLRGKERWRVWPSGAA